MAHDVFISYSSKNKQTADAICHVLEQQRIKCWIAPRNIGAGERYGTVIEKAIKECKVFIIVFSKESSISPWVESELNVAFTDRKVIMPFRIDETDLDGEMRLILSNKHWIEAYPNPEKQFRYLVDSIVKLLGIPINDTKQSEEDNVLDHSVQVRQENKEISPEAKCPNNNSENISQPNTTGSTFNYWKSLLRKKNILIPAISIAVITIAVIISDGSYQTDDYWNDVTEALPVDITDVDTIDVVDTIVYGESISSTTTNGATVLTRKFSNGDVYVGESNNGQPHGQGAMTYSNGHKYVGTWNNGYKEGYGQYTWTSGEMYVGEWKNGLYNGQGTFTFPSGEMYVGSFKDGFYHGKGTYTNKDGTTYSGRWENDKYKGE